MHLMFPTFTEYLRNKTRLLRNQKNEIVNSVVPGKTIVVGV